MVEKQLLELRNARKAKKPTFLRQEGHKRIKLEEKWRLPKGAQSKLRRKYKGKKRMPSLGFCSPSKVKGLTREGFKPRLVKNLKELEGFDSKTETVVVGKIGDKKRVEILKFCLEKKFNVTNIKDVQTYIKNVEDRLKEKKKETKEREEKKKKAKEKALKKKEEKKEEGKEKLEEKIEETKKGQKSEKIKVLEKRE